MSIIAISGKIGAGKDLCGKIIQYLTDTSISDFYTFEQWQCEAHNSHNKNQWQIKKFADALKDIVCILTGCTREQLEDQDFNDSLLPEEWIRYGYADGFIKKYIGNGEMGTPIMNNKQCDKERYEIELRTNWQTAYKAEHTYRSFLQMLGVAIRDIHEDTWVNALMSKYIGINYTHISENCPRQGVYEVTEFDELIYGEVRQKYPNWIITDVRFPNELKAVKDKDGITIRVNRFEPYDSCIKSDQRFMKEEHPFETSLDSAEFDYTIVNDSTIEELVKKIKEILEKEKIIMFK